jgi:hypothetical protein
MMCCVIILCMGAFARSAITPFTHTTCLSLSLYLSLSIYIYRKYLAQGQGIRPIPHDQEGLSHGARLSVHVSTHERNYVFCYLHAYIWLQI